MNFIYNCWDNFRYSGFITKKLHNLSFNTPTEEDYENVERTKTRLELILLSLVVFGIEICYAAETAFVTPILQKIGVPGKQLQFKKS
jgi:hypothetical protein